MASPAPRRARKSAEVEWPGDPLRMQTHRVRKPTVHANPPCTQALNGRDSADGQLA
ncbi:MAG TPA: hypothetical protein VIJ33_05580 [Solirubrobacteraceae bacterium]